MFVFCLRIPTYLTIPTNFWEVTLKAKRKSNILPCKYSVLMLLTFMSMFIIFILNVYMYHMLIWLDLP